MTKEDRAIHKGLMQILNDGTFPLQARDVAVFSRVYKWASELPELLKDHEIKKKVVKKVTK